MEQVHPERKYGVMHLLLANYCILLDIHALTLPLPLIKLATIPIIPNRSIKKPLSTSVAIYREYETRAIITFILNIFFGLPC